MGLLHLGAALVTALPYFFRLEASYYANLGKRQFAAKQQTDSETNLEYDFIIVGAGTAGCLLANRLSSYFTVLLLEEGGPAPSLTEVPAFRLYAYDVEGVNYLYKSVKQKSLFNRRLLTSMGRILGGSFAHNELFYSRGHSRDFDNWVTLTGDSSWKYKNLLPIFKKLEKYTGPSQSDQLGRSGPFPVYSRDSYELRQFKKAAKELGYKFADPNEPQSESFTPADWSTTSRAMTSCSILVTPFVGIRKNLHVLTYAAARKILFQGKSATGVNYSRFHKTFTAYAKKEVIVSAGSFGSALFLIKSGIGPSRTLAKAKITSVAELPVGSTLEDHPVIFFNVSFNYNPSTVYYNTNETSFKSFFNENPEGILSEVGPKALGFFISSYAKSIGESDWPDLQFYWETSQVDSLGKPYTILGMILTRPEATGTFRLNTKKYLRGVEDNVPLALIDYKLLDDKNDRARILEGVKIILKIFNAPSLKKLGMKIMPDDFCPTKAVIGSDEYWDCIIRRYTITDYHPVATCRMGHGVKDKRAVVDSKFRVLGVNRLRVVGAAIFPRITNSNTNSPTLMVAEKAALTILKSFGILE